MPRSTPLLAYATGLLLATAGAHAQVVIAVPDTSEQPAADRAVGRPFPEHARRGRLRVIAPPEVEIDGEPARLAPGARIHSPQNALVFASNLIGTTVVVNYTRETGGLVREVWLLTPEEAKLRRKAPPRPQGPYDDGKTPFDQLPTFDDLRRRP